jgi:prepilin-type N-terminal cleavage/methylation domain-containing protein
MSLVSREANRGGRGQGFGFTLIELLVVMAIIAIVLSLAAPAIGDAMRRARFNRGLGAIIAELEMAQQVAVAGSTYTWVAFAVEANEPVRLISARSLTGASPVSASIDLTSNNSQREATQLAAIQTLEGVTISDTLPNEASFRALPNEFSTAITPKSSVVSLLARVPGQTGSKTFAWVIEFNPMGEATVRQAGGASPVDAVKVIVVPSASGAPTQRDQEQAAFVWITGQSGASRVWQP